LILVTHSAIDHLGETEAIAKQTGAIVVCGQEVKIYLASRGVPASQIVTTTWGIALEVEGIRIQPVECHHWSHLMMPDGSMLTGVPMGFVVYVDPGVRFYHYGDTALFSDLKLIGQLYRPTVGAIGIANPDVSKLDIEGPAKGPARMLSAEMSPREGVLASQWLGIQTVLPCHYSDPNDPLVREFISLMKEAKGRGEEVAEVVVLKAGDEIELEPAEEG
jgi:L-ascorbate metabolism protein UlaG (beta-lactamase superfamily)